MALMERMEMFRAQRRVAKFADASEQVIRIETGRTEGEELDLIASDRALYVCVRHGWVMMRTLYSEIRAASWSPIDRYRSTLRVEFQPTESGPRVVTFEIDAPRGLGHFVASRVRSTAN